MNDKHYEIFGIVGFIIAGLIFIAVGVRAGDILTTAGSAIWTVSCGVWMVPLVRSKKNFD